MIADAHTDLLMELGHRQHRLGESNVFARTWLPLFDAGGVGLQICPIFVPLEHQPGGTLRHALGQAVSFHAAARENPERVCVVRTAGDLHALVVDNALALKHGERPPRADYDRRTSYLLDGIRGPSAAPGEH